MNVIPVDMTQVVSAVVMSEPRQSVFDGETRQNRDGVPVWEFDLAVAVAGVGGSVIRLKIATATAPAVALGQPVTVTGLRARVWEMEPRPGAPARHGVAWSADAVVPVGLPAAPGPVAKRPDRES